MISPKSRHKPPKRESQPRRHTNKKFYGSKAWRTAREAYLTNYQIRLHRNVSEGFWETGGHKFILSPSQQTQILSMDKPCEQCLKLFCAEAYDTMSEGKELDHIIPINPEDALDRVVTPIVTSFGDGFVDGYVTYEYGDPLDQNNYQWLCRRHHSKKSQRERL